MAKRKKKIIPDKKDRKSGVIGVVLILLAILVLISLFTYSDADLTEGNEIIKNRIGLLGAYISEGLFYVFGYVAFLIPISLIIFGVFYIRKIPSTVILGRLIGVVSIIVALCALLGILTLNDYEDTISLYVTWGGSLGVLLAGISVKVFGVIGSYIIIIGLVLVSLILYTNISVAFILEVVGGWFALFGKKVKEGLEKRKKDRLEKKEKREEEERKAKEREAGKTKDEDEVELVESDEKIDDDIPPPPPVDEEVEKLEFDVEEGEPTLPPLSLLSKPIRGESSVTDGETEGKRVNLLRVLKDYGIDVKDCSLGNIGPRTTRYDVRIMSGERVAKIEKLEKELALAFRVDRVRVSMESGVRGSISVDIPNDAEEMIVLRDILETDEFKNSEGILPLAMGIAQDGEVVVEDLTGMPHLLIGGATGSGKSVFLNSIMNSLIFQYTYEQVKMILIDLKRVEFGIYCSKDKYLPHLLFKVLTEQEEVLQSLNWLVSEMEERYQLLATEGSRNIEGYNKKMSTDKLHSMEDDHPVYASPTSSKLPYIILVIDELGDLMSVLGRKAEEPLTRLAQMARAVGIHLVVATQRPSVDVITGLIKANFPTRISFQVSSKTDSRTILDKNGAESLLGDGDYLYLPVGAAEPRRIQAPYISTNEVNNVVSFLTRTKPEPPKDVSIVEEQEEGLDVEGELDDLYYEALNLVVKMGQASISLLQRKLKVGYARAGRIIDQLEKTGVVGPHEGSKARDVLLKPDEIPPDVRKKK